MGDPVALAELLQSNLRKIVVPENYQALRERLTKSQPNREQPIVKESPENCVRRSE